MWEGQLIARFVTEITDLEEETIGTTPFRSTGIPESSRFHSIVMATDIPGHGRLVCTHNAIPTWVNGIATDDGKNVPTVRCTSLR